MGKARGRGRDLIALGIALAGLFLGSCPCSLALDPTLNANQYAHTSWRILEGLGKGYIYSIAQTPDGYLWLGTELGLLRFDGVRNVAWQPPDQHLPPGTIRSLLVTRDGTLWIGAKGLASWKGGRLTRYPELSNQFVLRLLEDREGTVWVGSEGVPTGKLCAIHNGSLQCYGDDGGLGFGVFGLYEDGKGGLWAGVKDGLWRWKPGPPRLYSLPGEPDGIQAICEDTDGTLLVGWKGGIYRFADGKTEPYSHRSPARQFRATKILRDRDGGLWIRTSGEGLMHVHQGRTDVFLPTDGLSGEDVRTVFEDREGSIWVATNRGLDQFRDFAVATFTSNQGLLGAVTESVLADKDGSVWIATHGGLNRWDHGQITIPRISHTKRARNLTGQAPTSLFQDDRGRIWVPTLRDFGYLENGRFTSLSGVPGGNILAIVQDSAGNLWVDNEHLGLFCLSPRNEVRQIPWTQLGHKDHASVLAADPYQAGLWIGFFLGGIAYFTDGKIQQSYTEADGLGGGRVSGFLFDHEGTLWVSTEAGLSRLKNGHVITLTNKNGFPCDTVHWVMEDDDHSLWLYTACGLVRIERSELDAWVAAVDKDKDTKHSIKTTVFDSSDGVRIHSEGAHYNPQVAKTSEGKLWFTFDGISVIDPRHIPFNKIPPPVNIEQIIANDGQAYGASPGLHLPPRIKHLEIDYTALSFVAPSKVHFRFKLEGQDRDWRDVDIRRQAFYTNLAPGNYRFRVTACNNSGVWNEAGASLDFFILPAYYQTNWFWALCTAGFLALLWGLYQLRLRQVAHSLRVRFDERTRIAGDLHDTLMQTIQGSKLVVDDALKKSEDHARMHAAMKEVSGWLGQAMQEGRAVLISLRASITETTDLSGALRRATEECRLENLIEASFSEVGDVKKIRSVVRDEVYRIGHESIRNACSHSQCNKLDVVLSYSKDLSLRVNDNGIGIEPSIAVQGKDGHFGLQGMRERAARIGGKLTIVSSVGSGTEITVIVPGSIAFESEHGAADKGKVHI